jgi:hypothetical protein
MSEFLEQLGIENEDPEYVPGPLFSGQESEGIEVVPDCDTSILCPTDVEEVPHRQVSEVEKRLEKAFLYQQWTTGSLYDTRTDTAIEVEAEFKAFALQKLNELVGISLPQSVNSGFDENEVLVLKALAQKIIKAPTLLGQNAPKVEKAPKPAPQRVQKQPPKAEPKPVAKPVGRPKLNRQSVPQEVAKPPVAAPQVPQTKPPVATQVPLSNKKPQGPAFYKDGESVVEGNKQYTIKWVRINSAVYGPAEEGRMDRMPLKTCLLLKDGITVYKTEGDELYKIVKMDKTPKVRPVEAVPFPSIQGMETVTALAAGRAAAAVNNRFNNQMTGR